MFKWIRVWMRSIRMAKRPKPVYCRDCTFLKRVRPPLLSHSELDGNRHYCYATPDKSDPTYYSPNITYAECSVVNANNDCKKYDEDDDDFSY